MFIVADLFILGFLSHYNMLVVKDLINLMGFPSLYNNYMNMVSKKCIYSVCLTCNARFYNMSSVPLEIQPLKH